MRIFKFGGASVKDADAVRNVKKILENYNSGPLVVVISAMGKTTNALENVLNKWFSGEGYSQTLELVKSYHFEILENLIPDKANPIWEDLNNVFNKLEKHLQSAPKKKFDAEYDFVVSQGEILSTKIVSAYLNDAGIANKWIDARDFIITNDLHREARIKWETTERLIATYIPQMTEKMPVITQGFIGATGEDVTTTLGREGSDFTASIFAYCLDAVELVIWKDVPGVLNADPKKYPDTVKFDRLSYHDAVEMTYYGASVLHPKTIKPLQNKNIPLLVRSFIHPEATGTIIQGNNPDQHDIPIIISKDNQELISLSTKDYSFIAEENIEKIFDGVVRHGIKVNVMQNSAINFTICVDGGGEAALEAFKNSLNDEFDISGIPGLELINIKYPTPEILKKTTSGKKILFEMRSGDTVQFVVQQIS